MTATTHTSPVGVDADGVSIYRDDIVIVERDGQFVPATVTGTTAGIETITVVLNDAPRLTLYRLGSELVVFEGRVTL